MTSPYIRSAASRCGMVLKDGSTTEPVKPYEGEPSDILMDGVCRRLAWYWVVTVGIAAVIVAVVSVLVWGT